jgi:NTE family protein
MRQKQIHRMRHVIAELVARLPEQERQTEDVRALASYGCLTQMHVVRLLAPSLQGENHTKDIDFSPAGIEARRQAGYDNTRAVLAREPWATGADPLEGFVLHEAAEGQMVASAG